MSRQKRVGFAAVGFAVATLGVGVAHAQDAASKATAVQLFDEADRLMSAGKFAQACPKYAASHKLDPQLGALLHLADCYAKNGQLASAWSSFRDAEEIAQQRGDARAALAKEHASSLEPRLSRLTLVVSDTAHVAGLEIRVDGNAIAPAAWGSASPSDPGMHAVEVSAPGRKPWSSNFKVVGERQNLSVEIPVLEASDVAAPPVAATPPASDQVQPSRDGDRGGPWKIVGWTSVGIGVVALGAGTLFLVKRNDTLEKRNSVCPGFRCTTQAQVTAIEDYTDDAKSADTLSVAGFIAGGVFVAGGVAALLFGGSSRESSSNAAWLAPVVAPGGFALAGGARF